MLSKTIVVAVLCTSIANGFNIPRNAWVSKGVDTRSYNPLQHNLMHKYGTRMSMTTEESEATTAPSTTSSPDFSKFTVGQEYQGTAISAKPFGVFVDISEGTNVLLPRSLLSRGSYEKLKKLADEKSSEAFKIELVGVSAEEKTLSGKYISANLKERADISTLKGKDLTGQTFKATVVSAHDFGIFAELEEFGVEGLVPASKLPSKLAAAEIPNKFPAGTVVDVQIDQLNVDDNKLVLTMRSKNVKSDVSAFKDIPNNEWMQAVVESVTSFGLFVKPIGMEATGLVHVSQVPRDLISTLKKRSDSATAAASSSSSSNTTDVESLFGVGDVVKVRVQNVKDSNRVGLTMLRHRASDDADDDYVPEGRDPEGEEGKFNNAFQDDEDENYDAEDTLLWWRGAAYVKSTLLPNPDIDEEIDVLNESSGIVEGTWRRMFELDLREDQADFSSKMAENELKELAEEIGELDGLDIDVVDVDRAAQASYGTTKLGSFVSSSAIPADWQKEVEFFSDLQETESAFTAKLRGGKAGDTSELESLLKEIDMEMSAKSAKMPVVAAAATETPAEPAATEPAAATTATTTETAETAEVEVESAEPEAAAAVAEETGGDKAAAAE